MSMWELPPREIIIAHKKKKKKKNHCMGHYGYYK